MRFFQRWLLSRVWVPAVAVVTLAALTPRVVAKINDDWRVSRAAGVYNWEEGPANQFWPGETRFRWTKGRAALREPVRGAVMTVAIYLARPDLATHRVNLRVTVGGVPTEQILLVRNGWQMLTWRLSFAPSSASGSSLGGRHATPTQRVPSAGTNPRPHIPPPCQSPAIRTVSEGSVPENQVSTA